MKRKSSAGTVGDEGQVRRRSLLTRGGVVLAGVIGATAGGAALTAGRAEAATPNPVYLSSVNNGGNAGAATEIDAANGNGAPSVIIGNSGSTGQYESTPALRLTPAGSGLVLPSSATVGGDLVATNDGELWFTHEIESIVAPATVHTDVNSTQFVPLIYPVRILDTRYAKLRESILDGSGKLDSSGRLLKGQTIHIDLTSLVLFGDAVVANLTVTGTAATGNVTVFPGGPVPNASSINFLENWTIANQVTCGINNDYSETITDSIAITTVATTHVILDIAGFHVGNPAQVTQPPAAASASTSASTSSRAARISKAIQARR